MKKIVDPVSINEVANYTKNKLEELAKVKEVLINDIKSIRNYYKGTDAELIIKKYLERLKVVDVIINNYSNLKDYFLIISEAYSNSLKKAKTSMESINNSFSINDSTNSEINNIENTTLSIEL